MKTKVLLSALCLPVAFAACSNEELIEMNANNNDVMNRKVVDLEVLAGIDSRLSVNEAGKFQWDADDQVGAVLVDHATQWTAGSAHIGNNRWDYNGSNSFSTDGTTVEGAWMFYFPYQASNSKRGNIVTAPVAIKNQEYDADGNKMLANDFRISPIYFINAAETKAEIDLGLQSVYGYGMINATFAEDVTIEKVLINSEDKTNIFNNQLTIDYSKVATLASMNYAKMENADEELVPQELGGDANAIWNSAEDKTPNLTLALAEMQEWGLGADGIEGTEDDAAYTADKLHHVISGTGTTTTNHILVDCGEGVTTTNKVFKSRVLLPAGSYAKNIDVYFYTNKGIYKYDLNGTDANPLLVKRAATVNLHNIHKVKGTEETPAPTTIDFTEAEVVSQAPILTPNDLIRVINAVTTPGALNVTEWILDAAEAVIDDAVVAALEANTNVTSLTVGNINITAAGTEEGAAKISKLNSNGIVTVKSGANVVFDGAQNIFSTLAIEAEASVEAKSYTSLPTVNTAGTFKVTKAAFGSALNVTAGTVDIQSATSGAGAWNITAGTVSINSNLNKTAGNISVAANGIFEVADDKTLTITSNLSNAGTINLSGTISTIYSNTGTINMIEDTKALVNELTTNTGKIYTCADSEITVVANNEGGEIYYTSGAKISTTSGDGHVVYVAPSDIAATDFSAISPRVTKVKFTADFTYSHANTAAQIALATLPTTVTAIEFPGNLTLTQDWAHSATTGVEVIFIGAGDVVYTATNKTMSNVSKLIIGKADDDLTTEVDEAIETYLTIEPSSTIQGITSGSGMVVVNNFKVWNDGTVSNVDGANSTVGIWKKNAWN